MNSKFNKLFNTIMEDVKSSKKHIIKEDYEEEVQYALNLRDGQGSEVIDCIQEAIMVHGQQNKYTVDDYIKADCVYESDYTLHVYDIEGKWDEYYILDGY